MNARDARLLELVLGLRDPLSRIELALAEGLPAAGMPARFVEGVRGAVAEADARLEAMLRALRAGSCETAADGDCRGTLDEVAGRVRGPLAAQVRHREAEPQAALRGDLLEQQGRDGPAAFG